eukprot:1347146-Rhodomonas_salina.4
MGRDGEREERRGERGEERGGGEERRGRKESVGEERGKGAWERGEERREHSNLKHLCQEAGEEFRSQSQAPAPYPPPTRALNHGIPRQKLKLRTGFTVRKEAEPGVWRPHCFRILCGDAIGKEER